LRLVPLAAMAVLLCRGNPPAIKLARK